MTNATASLEQAVAALCEECISVTTDELVKCVQWLA